MKKIGLSIVIPSLNGLAHLKDFLIPNCSLIKETLFSCNFYSMIEMIVVDDNSTDHSLLFLEECQKEFEFLISGKNPQQGAGSARNYGVSLSRLEEIDCELKFILFIDNDVLLDKSFFVNSIKYLKKNIFAVSCNGINYYTNAPQDGVKIIEFKRGFFRFTKNIYRDKLKRDSNFFVPSFGAQGAYFFVNFSDYVELKGFDENMDPYLLEETDLIYRGIKRGKSCVYAKDVTGFHKVGGTINSKASKRTKLLSKRNRIYFVWKNLHDKRLFITHLFFLGLSLFHPLTLKAFLQALPMLRDAKKLNSSEKPYLKRSDREILEESLRFDKKYQG